MTAVRSQTAGELAPTIALIAPAGLVDVARTALLARGLRSEVIAVATADAATTVARGAVLAWAPMVPPTAQQAADLASTCATAAAAGRPLILFCPPPRRSDPRSGDRAATLAYLRAYGAVIVNDPDAWIEAIVLVVGFGLPTGGNLALIAPEGGYLAASALALTAEAEALGTRLPIASNFDPSAPTDVVLYDASLQAPVGVRPMTLPVRSRADDATTTLSLVGLRASVAAASAVGRAAARIEVGPGPAAKSASAELDVDRERLLRQVDKIGSYDRRLGDHEAKAMLSSYGISITRQAVATTPSAALRIARKAGFPVEIKRWGPDAPTERAGCLVERNVASAADVRRAFLTVLGTTDANVDGGDNGAVIVRETPPTGREVSASFVRHESLGWTVILEVPGTPTPAAAPAPLTLHDAQDLAAHVPSTRQGDPEPDRVALANILRRASHMVVDLEATIEELELSRIVVGGPRTMVIDAAIVLTSRGRR